LGIAELGLEEGTKQRKEGDERGRKDFFSPEEEPPGRIICIT
jgi:hypothetical protein